MASLTFETVVGAPLEAVWAFHDDPAANLGKLSPAEAAARVESADMPIREGSRVVVYAKGPLGRKIRWVARIVEHRPPHGVVFGEEARFVDEQEEGPFAYWRHEHDFEAIDAKTTRIVDRVTYRLPWGPIGWVGDWLVVRWQIRKLFACRACALRQILGAGGKLG